MNRLSNYGLWIAVVAFLLQILLKAGVISLGDFNDYQTIVKTFLDLLVLAGILNNPTTNNKGFLDD